MIPWHSVFDTYVLNYHIIKKLILNNLGVTVYNTIRSTSTNNRIFFKRTSRGKLSGFPRARRIFFRLIPTTLTLKIVFTITNYKKCGCSTSILTLVYGKFYPTGLTSILVLQPFSGLSPRVIENQNIAKSPNFVEKSRAYGVIFYHLSIWPFDARKLVPLRVYLWW